MDWLGVLFCQSFWVFRSSLLRLTTLKVPLFFLSPFSHLFPSFLQVGLHEFRRRERSSSFTIPRKPPSRRRCGPRGLSLYSCSLRPELSDPPPTVPSASPSSGPRVDLSVPRPRRLVYLSFNVDHLYVKVHISNQEPPNAKG